VVSGDRSRFDGVGGRLDRDVELDPVALSGTTKDVVRHRLAAGRAPDADADAKKILGVQVLLDRLQTVVARKAAPGLELDATDVEIELVVDDDDRIVRLDAVALYEVTDRTAGLVHEGLRERDDHPGVADAKLGRRGGLLRGLEPIVVAFGQHLDDIRAHVVARALVVRTRVAQSDHEQVGGRPGAF